MSEVLAPLAVAPRFRRSVQLEHDFAEGIAALDGYQATPLVMHVLDRILTGLESQVSSRAFSLIGPYGTGKSAFGLFLAHMARSTLDQRHQYILDHSTTNVIHEPHIAAPRLLPVLLSGNNSSLRGALLTATRRVILSIDPGLTASFLDASRAAIDVDPQMVTMLLEQASTAIAASTEYAGIIFIIDELGQFLDYTAKSGDDRDLFVLQTLAEMATRTRGSVCAVVTILHQAFDLYSHKAGNRQRTEWAKVQGRFADIPFQEPESQLVRMIGRALATEPSSDDSAKRHKWAEQVASSSDLLGLRPADINHNEWTDLLSQAYPLHPTVLVLLPTLFRQLAQNERSLFAFLASDEPRSLQDFVRTSTTDPIYRIPQLFAYIEGTLGISLFNHTRGRRWAELAEARIRLGEPLAWTEQTLTTIGTLGALGQHQHLRASEQCLAFALTDTIEYPEITSALQQLDRRQFITYRRYRGSWVLWEGSDLNLEALITQARRDLQPIISIVELLHRYTDISPLVARRHSYQTGAMRVFPVVFVHSADLTQLPTPLNRDGGEILCIIPGDDEERLQALAWLNHGDRSGEAARLAILPRQVGSLREVLLEVAALQHVLKTEGALHHDAPARRELLSRLVEAQQTMDTLLRQLTGLAGNQWWWCGQPQHLATVRERDALLSQVCDTVFSATPRIWNELIVRRQISAMSAKARRNLIELMLETSPGEPLSFTGNPPERAIYESVFRSSGIHRPDALGWWHWGSPAADNPLHLLPTWNCMLDWIEQTTNQLGSLQDLYAMLEAPPYGVKAGLHPLLFTALYLANRGMLALYEHGSFVAVPDVPVFERLARQPAHFAVRLSRVEGGRIAVYQRVARALAPHLLLDTTPRLMQAVGPLLTLVRRAPDWSRQTRQISPTAQAIRAAILATRAPDLLLFEELPLACGLPPFLPTTDVDPTLIDDFFIRLREGLTEIQEAYPTLIKACLTHICAGFSITFTDAATVRTELAQRYARIEPVVLDVQLRAVGTRLEQTHEGTGWVESIGALLCRKPMPQWSDDDLAAFGLHSAELARRFRQVEEVALVQHVLPATVPLVRVSLTNPRTRLRCVVVIPSQTIIC